MTIANVVFDLDGTLVDSAADVLHALRLAAAEANIEPKVPLTPALIGPPLRELLGSLGAEFSDSQAEVAVLAFRRIYDHSLMPRTIPYAGVPEAIARLRAAGCRLFVATNKPHLPTAAILDRHFPGAFVDFCCTDSVAGTRLDKTGMLSELLRRHGLESAGSVMVGDATSDLRAGRALNWRTLAVLYGYGAPETLRAERPDWEVASACRIADVLLGDAFVPPARPAAGG